MQQIVAQWRAASPSIPRFWRDAERAALRALETPGRTYTLPCGVRYRKDADGLRCRLPSGRVLTYWGARPEGGGICFMGQNQTTRKWETTETWGGKLVENIVQAYARDCLAVAMLRLEQAGYDIVPMSTTRSSRKRRKAAAGRTWPKSWAARSTGRRVCCSAATDMKPGFTERTRGRLREDTVRSSAAGGLWQQPQD